MNHQPVRLPPSTQSNVLSSIHSSHANGQAYSDQSRLLTHYKKAPSHPSLPENTFSEGIDSSGWQHRPPPPPHPPISHQPFFYPPPSSQEQQRLSFDLFNSFPHHPAQHVPPPSSEYDMSHLFTPPPPGLGGPPPPGLSLPNRAPLSTLPTQQPPMSNAASGLGQNGRQTLSEWQEGLKALLPNVNVRFADNLDVSTKEERGDGRMGADGKPALSHNLPPGASSLHSMPVYHESFY